VADVPTYPSVRPGATVDRLFPIEEYPEVPLVREPRRRKSEGDARFKNDYPPEWHRCSTCNGRGTQVVGMGLRAEGYCEPKIAPCSDCLGMRSLKARVRLEAGHRCLRCKHPYVPKGDAASLGIPPSWREGGWSACDGQCVHGGPIRYRQHRLEEWREVRRDPAEGAFLQAAHSGVEVEAQWRILTVHHADGDKANVRWWNLLALCQRCHLEIQAKVVMERVYPHEHSSWFRPFVAGYYAWAYLREDLTRAEVAVRQDELLALERIA
jgi:hypothetical protein